MPLGLPAPASVGRYERRRDGSVSQRDAGCWCGRRRSRPQSVLDLDLDLDLGGSRRLAGQLAEASSGGSGPRKVCP
jgi:hypothetical protein